MTPHPNHYRMKAVKARIYPADERRYAREREEFRAKCNAPFSGHDNPTPGTLYEEADSSAQRQMEDDHLFPVFWCVVIVVALAVLALGDAIYLYFR